jgi:hypothetical protein
LNVERFSFYKVEGLLKETNIERPGSEDSDIERPILNGKDKETDL